MSNKDEKEFRLRPRKPPVPKGQSEARAWAVAFKRIMHYSRMSRCGAGPKRGAGPRPAAHARFQRCAVRVTYTRNATRGQWRAHGRYLARESATSEKDTKSAGFDEAGQGSDVASRLEAWQTNRDSLLWKIILSPEFGDRIDLERLTRDVMKKMEKDLSTELEWVAVAHHNTGHPHVHVALRGIRTDRQPLQLERRYIKEGIRMIAEDFCTRQLGYRTELDAAEAERREVQEKRFTSLDRIILKRGEGSNQSNWFSIAASPPEAAAPSDFARIQGRHVAGRLAFLAQMGLAVADEPGVWRVRRDFESILRTMQRTTDRQKMMAVHGVLMSDERLPIEMLDRRHMATLEGRILVHGEDEGSGHSYLMLEGTDAKVYLIHYTPEMERARSRGILRTNSFVRIHKAWIDGRSALEVSDMGDSESILKNRAHLEGIAQRLMKRGIVPTEDGWGGWLGRYQAALRECAFKLDRDREQSEKTKQKERLRDRDRSRSR